MLESKTNQKVVYVNLTVTLRIQELCSREQGTLKYNAWANTRHVLFFNCF